MCEIGQRPDPYCRVCQVPEDVTHYLMICPVQKQLQDRLRQKTCKDIKRPNNLKTILTCDSCKDIAYDYIKATGHLLLPACRDFVLGTVLLTLSIY